MVSQCWYFYIEIYTRYPHGVFLLSFLQCVTSVSLEFSTNHGRSWSLLHMECLPEICAGPHLPHSTIYASENYSGWARSLQNWDAALEMGIVGSRRRQQSTQLCVTIHFWLLGDSKEGVFWAPWLPSNETWNVWGCFCGIIIIFWG